MSKSVYRNVIIAISLIVVLAIVGMYCVLEFTTLSTNHNGTFSQLIEPDSKNIYFALKDERFELYNNAGIYESGSIQAENDQQYKLVSERNNAIVGEIQFIQPDNIKLQYENMDIQLEKISKSFLRVN